MRFLSVSFRSFGPFAERTFDLSQGGPGLHLIHGRNEAGKSSALRGLQYLLFGFPERTNDDFIYKSSAFRIHATLANAHGDVIECVRRKGRKETLRAGDDKTALSDETLRAFIGGLSEDQFGQLFGLDHGLLEEGGRLIAEGKGDLGEAIFAAGAGIAGLRGIQDRLEKERDAIFKARGQNQPAAIALRKLKELSEEVRTSSLAAETYALKEQEYRSAQTAAEQNRIERDRARAEQSRLERFRAALPTIGQLRDARERLRDVEAARTLAVGFEKDYRDISAALLASQTTRKDMTADIAKLEAEIKALELPAALLAEEDTIEKLKDRVAVWSKEKDEALKADARKREMEAKARDLFRDLVGSTDLEQAKTYRLTVEQTNRIRTLGREQALVTGELKNHVDRIAKLQQQITDTESKQNRTPKTEDPSKVRRLVDLITAEGRLDEQFSQLGQACAQEESRIRDGMAALVPPCSTPVEEITALPLPQPEVVEWHRQELSKLKKQSDESDDELRRARHELIALESQIESFGHGEPIPSTEELAETRQHRDAGLNGVRQVLAGHSPTEEDGQFISQFAPNRTLIDAVEVSVRQCDTLADRLRLEADRIVRWHGLKSQRDETRKKIALGEADLEKRNADLARAQAKWNELWQPSGIVPEAPEVMTGWLIQVARLRERVEAWQSSVKRRDELAARCEQHFAWLKDALPEIRSARSLQDGLATAREQVKLIEEVRNEQKQHAADLERLRGDLAAAQLDRTKAETRMQAAQQEWAAAVGALQLPATVDIATVETCLTRADEMQGHLKDARIKGARVREIELERDTLLQAVNELRLRLEPACRATTVDWIEKDFADLDRKLSIAQSQRTRCEQIRKQIASKIEAREVVINEQTNAEAKLAAMTAEAGVADAKELPDAIERFRRRSEAMKHRHDLEAALAQQAQGMPIQQFEEAALDRSEGIGQAILLLEEKIRQADQEVAQADIAASQTDTQLKEWRKASEAAAKARQDAALCARRLQDHVAQYATLHLARVVLDRAVERYRARNQDTMLARAGAFFRQLTDGDFATLEIESDDGKPVLKALRSDHARLDASVSVDGLSDGTRDQLFLALRLAGIEQHLAEREPMPLIIDDVLINFDDRRACATLRCIAELSKQTQVLLFTHHQHIVELARTSVLSQLVIHEFPGAS